MLQDFEKIFSLGKNLFFEKKFGIKRVRKELEKKEISADVIDQVIKKLDIGFEERHIKYIVFNKYGSKIFIDREREKIVKFLVRYGYDAEKVVNILNMLESEEIKSITP